MQEIKFPLICPSYDSVEGGSEFIFLCEKDQTNYSKFKDFEFFFGEQ
jgi:hypothetical protein